MRKLLWTLLTAAVLTAAGPLMPVDAQAIPSQPDFTRNGALLGHKSYSGLIPLIAGVVPPATIQPGHRLARRVLRQRRGT